MKTIVSSIYVAAMLVVSISSASATSWIQASSTEEQVASDPKPKVVTMNSTDGAKNIKMEKGVIRVNENGSFFLMAAAQVGGKTKGVVRMWMRVNGKDVDNSNTEQFIADASSTTVLVCQRKRMTPRRGVDLLRLALNCRRIEPSLCNSAASLFTMVKQGTIS